MHTNLNWSYYLLKNNIDPLLMSRLQSKYDAFTPSQRGGPLLFALLMAELLYTNESAVHTLKDQIQKYKINKVPREDIKKISSVILLVAKRIWYSKGESFPENFVDTIISLLQTSSVPPFNEQYKTIALTRASDKAQERVAVTSGAAAPVSTYQNNLATVERLLTMPQRSTTVILETTPGILMSRPRVQPLPRLLSPIPSLPQLLSPAHVSTVVAKITCSPIVLNLPTTSALQQTSKSIWTQRRRRRPTKLALLPHLLLLMALTIPNLPSILIVPTMRMAPMALLPSVPANGILLVKALLRTDSSGPVPTATNLTNSTLKLVVGI
jgi:hypothetical protein